MKTSEQTDLLAGALAVAQGQFPAVERSKTVNVRTRDGNSYSFDYAPLDAIIDAVRAPLAKQCIAMTQPVSFHEGSVTVTTRLQHGAQWMESELTFPLQEVAVKDLGGLITYLRRYALSPMLGITSEMDDDGNAASGDQRTVADRPAAAAAPPKPACPRCGKTACVFKSKMEEGYYCWRKKEGCGHTWNPDAAPKGHIEDEQSDPFGQSTPHPSSAGSSSAASQSIPSKEDELIPPERLGKLLALVEENDLGLWLKKTLKNEFYIDDPAKLRLLHVEHLSSQLKKALKEQEKDVARIRSGIKDGRDKKELFDYLAGSITLGPGWVAVLEKEIAG